MVMRGVIYMSAGSSLFLWEPASLPKFVFPLIPSIGALCMREREHACTISMFVALCCLVLYFQAVLRSSNNVHFHQSHQYGFHLISLFSQPNITSHALNFLIIGRN